MGTIAYYGTSISANIAQTDEGFILCRNCPISRCGWQSYYAGELPDSQKEKVGLMSARPDDSVRVWRDPSEVFHPASLASFEGKILLSGHPADGNLLDTYSTGALQCGHIQNVRRGNRPLDSGDMPVLADLLITDPALIDAVLSGKLRQLSAGYRYALEKRNGQIWQVEIRGNHVAVVPQGRAGEVASIQDAKPTSEDLAAKRANAIYSTIRKERYNRAD